jgi:hypothetical protein
MRNTLLKKEQDLKIHKKNTQNKTTNSAIMSATGSAHLGADGDTG